MNEFSGALVTFLQTDFWSDSAYIAERLISPEELLALARAGRLPGVSLPENSAKFVGPPMRDLSLAGLQEKYGQGQWSETNGQSMTLLLARRLMRDRFFKDAGRVAPADLRTVIESYASDYRRGHDLRVARAERGRSLWRAAQIHRYLGLELFGFENGPDFASAGGNFAWGPIATTRRRDSWAELYSWKTVTEAELRANVPVFSATADELWRSRHYGPRKERRFHYRYDAADLAWKAALLMPNDTEETARMLCIAGGRLKHRDPKAADRFYK